MGSRGHASLLAMIGGFKSHSFPLPLACKTQRGEDFHVSGLFCRAFFFQISSVASDRGQTPGVHAQHPELPESHPHKNVKKKVVDTLPWFFLPLFVFGSGLSWHRLCPIEAQLGHITSDSKPVFSSGTVAILAQGTHWAAAGMQAFVERFKSQRVPLWHRRLAARNSPVWSASNPPFPQRLSA